MAGAGQVAYRESYEDASIKSRPCREEMCVFFEVKYIHYYAGKHMLTPVISQTFDL